jgi:hypothetical protein
MGVGASPEREETGVGVGYCKNPNNRVTLTQIIMYISDRTGSRG